MSEDTQTQQSSLPTGEAPAEDTQQSGGSGEVTPEAIEQFWRNRQSQSDKAHAAEAAALRERIAALEGGGALPATTQSEDSNALIEQLRSQLAEEKQLRIVETRKAKYPFAAEQLDPVSLSQMDEGRLANLNSRLEPSRIGIDRNNPARTVAAEKPIDQMTTEELKAHLRTLPVPGQQPS